MKNLARFDAADYLDDDAVIAEYICKTMAGSWQQPAGVIASTGIRPSLVV